MGDKTAPVRLCCGERHYGPICPDGKVLCCLCFKRFNQEDLHVREDGRREDACRGCAATERILTRKYQMTYRLKPLNNRVLVKRDETKSETESGILLPEQARDKPNEGVVESVGWEEEDQPAHSVKPGDRVLMPTYGGTEVDVAGSDRKHTLIQEEDLMGVLVPVVDGDLGDRIPTGEVDLGDDFDEPLGERQGNCDGEVCESCQ